MCTRAPRPVRPRGRHRGDHRDPDEQRCAACCAAVPYSRRSPRSLGPAAAATSSSAALVQATRSCTTPASSSASTKTSACTTIVLVDAECPRCSCRTDLTYGRGTRRKAKERLDVLIEHNGENAEIRRKSSLDPTGSLGVRAPADTRLRRWIADLLGVAQFRMDQPDDAIANLKKCAPTCLATLSQASRSRVAPVALAEQSSLSQRRSSTRPSWTRWKRPSQRAETRACDQHTCAGDAGEKHSVCIRLLLRVFPGYLG